ncbi:MAG: hypothetical protein GX539_14860 [Candidatus Cloacimonetes bacterium]|nr:hypothetical protein [Candidatus Cloacimonadota bacterium]
MIAREAARAIDQRHVVCVYDELSGLWSALGVFPDPVTAVACGEQMSAEFGRAERGGRGLHVLVIPVEPEAAPPAVCKRPRRGGGFGACSITGLGVGLRRGTKFDVVTADNWESGVNRLSDTHEAERS